MDLTLVLASKGCICTLSSFWIVQSHPPWNEQFQLSPLAGLWGNSSLRLVLGAEPVAERGLIAIQNPHLNSFLLFLFLNTRLPDFFLFVFNFFVEICKKEFLLTIYLWSAKIIGTSKKWLKMFSLSALPPVFLGKREFCIKKSIRVLFITWGLSPF